MTIASYGYVIYVDGLETFNTGVLSGGFKKLTLKNIDLSNFIKISKSNDIKIYFFVKQHIFTFIYRLNSLDLKVLNFFDIS